MYHLADNRNAYWVLVGKLKFEICFEDLGIYEYDIETDVH
jgi:hypothetical protein